MPGLINWGNPTQQPTQESEFSSGVINWGGMFANDQARKAQVQQAFQGERDHLKQIQQSKGINNPGSLLDLQAKLAAGQISHDDYTKQFEAAAKQNNPAPFKINPVTIGQQTWESALSMAQGTARSIPELGASAQQLITRKPVTLTPNKAGAVVFGKAPIQSIQEKSQGAETSHPGGFHIPGTPITLSPKETGVADTALSAASDIPVASGLAKGVVKGAAKGVETAVAGAGKDAAVNDLIANTKTKALQSAAKPATPAVKTVGVAATAEKAAVAVPAELRSLAAKAQNTPFETLQPSRTEFQALKTNGTTLKDFYDSVKTAGPTKLNEAGGLPLGKAQDLIDKHQQSVKFSGDIQRFAASSEGAKGNLLNDSAKLIKNRTQLAPEEKTQLQALRDARATNQELPQVSDKVVQADKEATDFAKATIANDVERAKLEGNLSKAKSLAQRDPESYTHRVAQGKGSAFDYVLQNDRKNPLSVNFGKTTPADKTRTMFAAVDENGNRRVIAVKSQSGKTATGQKFSKPNQITAFENGKATESLGNLKTKANAIGKQFEGKDGHTYTIDNATADEITKASGQKYFTDPALTNHAAYLDSRIALENARMFDAIKKAPESKTFMVEPGETAPKGYIRADGVPQFTGYRFEPRVAQAIEDVFANRKPGALNKVSHAMRQSIVYFPLKHDFNMAAAYAVDRGASSLANPLAYGRMFKSWGQAFNDIRTKSDFYQQVAKQGFGLTTNDKKAFEDTFKKELQKLQPGAVTKIAKLSNLNPTKLYSAVQRLSVWDVQDFLNLARIHERMSPTLLQKVTGKKMNLEDAVRQTEKYSFQYKVPARVAGSRVASEALRSRLVFFGAYKYDQYKMVANAVKGALNITKPGEAVKNADKVAALAIGALLLWPEVNKGIQKLTGNPNAHATAPGPLAIPESINKVRTKQQTAGQAIGNQVSVGPVQQILDIKSNTDSFTGKKIADPNASEADQMKQRGKYLVSQLAPFQKVQGSKNAGPGKQVIGTLLSLAGASLPKNSPQTTKLNSLKYDTLPNARSEFDQKVQAGDVNGAKQIANNYNKQVLTAAKAAIQAAGKPVPSDQKLYNDLRKGQYLLSTSNKTIHNAQKPKQNTIDKLLQPSK